MNTPPADSSDDELLTPEELAKLIKVSPDTLRQWRHKKTGPAYTRVGRFIRYPRADVNAYVDARREQTTP